MDTSVKPVGDKPDEWFKDFGLGLQSVKDLRELSSNKTNPFFLATGFKLPHVQLLLPQAYYDMYKGKERQWEKNMELLKAPINSTFFQTRENHIINYKSKVVKDGKTVIKEESLLPFTKDKYDDIIRGYSGSISFLDNQLGKILDELDRLELWNNTVVILTSDHGMHNGEKGVWNKWTLYEESTRIPLMIYDPRSTLNGHRYGMY